MYIGILLTINRSSRWESIPFIKLFLNIPSYAISEIMFKTRLYNILPHENTDLNTDTFRSHLKTTKYTVRTNY